MFSPLRARWGEAVDGADPEGGFVHPLSWLGREASRLVGGWEGGGGGGEWENQTSRWGKNKKKKKKSSSAADSALEMLRLPKAENCQADNYWELSLSGG